MRDNCESCGLTRTLIIEDSGLGSPFKVCEECYRRLLNKALRPLEFFNLTAKHGDAYWLHDDFYDFETGEATAPEEDVVDSDKFPFPNLHEVKHNTDRLIDFAIVQFFIDDSVIGIIKSHDPSLVLEILKERLQKNEALNYKLFNIAANGLGSFAEIWIRENWKKRKKDEHLSIYAEAMIRCLPFKEAFEELTQEIELKEDKHINNEIGNLIYFERSETLDWIEKVKGRIFNVSDSWGTLAASSQFDWVRAEKWITEGRPLSLIAIDALMYCTTIGDRRNQIPWFQDHPPKLLNSEKPEIMASVLNEYLKKDNVPRVKNTVRRIINNLFHIVE